jgi:hypothetical protein
MSVIIAFFIGLTVSAEEIISDRKILKRESFLNLSRLSYLLSKVLILAILSAIQTALFVLIGNSIMQIKEMAMTYWLILFSSSIFANLLGLIISDAMKKTVNIYILIPFLVIPQLILSGVFISYDELNPRLSSPKTIPWYGEIITTRWAFEAIIVDNYKNNEYQKNFFYYEKLKSQSIYYKDYWIPEIKNQLNKYIKSEDIIQKNDILQLIKNEIIKHNNKEIPNFYFNNTNLLQPEKFNATIQEELLLHLNNIKNFYIGLYGKADAAIEYKKKELIDNYGAEYLTILKNNYHNESLERFVRRSNDIFSNRIIHYQDELIQKFDPVYEEPSTMVKAQFMSATKRIGENYYDTYYVNLTIIWILNILLFICLYLKILKKTLNLGYYIKSKIKN